MTNYIFVKKLFLLSLILFLFSCATLNQNQNYESIKKGMSTSDVSNKFGSPVQKHFAPNKVFRIKLTNGISLWEYHAGGHYITAIWLVKFENNKVIDLGRSQGAMLSDIKFGYLNK